ncbi:MAG: hypothetical protein OWU32_03915 [Firmicutes bacterium]|nr:hypothetical protein [Bacillota bacterium]
MFVDCHTHILPGVDDGARTMEDALVMARMAVAAGTTRMFATPHGYTSTYHVDPAVVRESTRALQARLLAEDIDLMVLPAMEVHHAVVAASCQVAATGAKANVSSIDLQRLRSGAALGFGAYERPDYVLLEFPFTSWPEDAGTTVAALHEAGTQVVLAHPERYDELQYHPSLVDEVLREGAWLQLTTGSILGRFGPSAERLSRTWLTAGCIHIIASDAHNAVSRPPGIRAAYERVCEEWGLADAAARCVANADAIWSRALAHADSACQYP